MMIDPANTNGKKLALVLWGENKAGEDDVAVFTGILHWDGSHLFLNRENNEPIKILDEWMERIKIVTEDIKDIVLGSEYIISLSVGNLPDCKGNSEYERIGLKWPQENSNDN